MKRRRKLSRVEQILKKQDDADIQIRVLRIATEFAEGFEFLRRYAKGKKVATIFGSARIKRGSREYKEIYDLAYRLAKKWYIVITGGGSGAMEAANHGAHDAGGISIGINISLPKMHKRGEKRNSFLTQQYLCKYFFARKTLLSFAAHVYIFVQGGFGTLDELFEMLTLVQTKKIPRIPIILKGRKYYSGLIEWISSVLEKNKMISKKDFALLRLVDTNKELLCLLKRLERSGDTRCCCQAPCPQ